MTIVRRRASTPPWTEMTSLLLTGTMLVALCVGAFAQSSSRGADLTILPTSPVQVKPEGRNALLTCRATGEGAKHVTGLRWRAPDGREVARPQAGALAKPKVYAESFQADGSLSLIFTELKTNDEGNYTCEAQYAGGERLQRSVEIRVIKAIRWVDAPTEQWPKQGQLFKVKCKVEAEPPPSVDWTKDGSPLDERYRVETDGLVIPDPGPEDDGVYTCRAIVVATGELQMRAIKVEVQEPPSFEKADRNATLNAKEDATLPCRALGRPPPEYVWIDERTGKDLTKAGGRFQVDSITGDLRVTPVRAEDDGAYACVARNRAGDARQRVFVQVLVPPRVALVHNTTQAAGKAAEIRCEARGRPPPAVEWRRQGHTERYVPGAQASDYRISTSSRAAGSEHPDRTDGVLSWEEVNRFDDGLYVCIATNKAGTAEAFAHLTVQFPPSFNSTPYNQTWSWAGHVANITCLAESIPNATIHWFFNERDIEKNEEHWFKKKGKGPQSWLEVDPSYERRYGAFKCRATNVHGVAEHVIILKEATRPGPLMQAVVDVTTATTLKFKLVGPSDDGGVPMKVYTVRYRKHNDIGHEYKTKSWPADSDYTLENLEPQTHYEFDFSATNDVGEGPWSAKVDKVMPKRSPPEPPQHLHHPAMSTHPDKPVSKTDAVDAKFPTHFELSWQIPADNGEPLEKYIISWCKARETEKDYWAQDTSSRGNCQEKTIDVNQRTTVFRLQPLQPDTLYMVHLYATNKIGVSKPGVLLLRTPPQGPGSVRPGDSPATAGEAPVLSSGALIAAVVVALLLALLLLDLSCFACRRAGVVAALCERARGSKDAGDSGGSGSHSGRYGASIRDAGAVFVAEKLPEKTPIRSKESLREETSPLAPALSSSVKRDTSALFDGKNTTVGRPFIGKDSAV